MKRIRIGFASGAILTVIGVLIRLFSRTLATTPISPNASTVNSGLEGLWIQLSMAMIIFGASIFLITFNHWLAVADDDSQSPNS